MSDLIWQYDEFIRVSAGPNAVLGVIIVPPRGITMELISIYLTNTSDLTWSIYHYTVDAGVFWYVLKGQPTISNRLFFPNTDYATGSINNYKGDLILSYDDELTIESVEATDPGDSVLIGVRAKLSAYAPPTVRYNNANLERFPALAYTNRITGG